MSKKIVEIKAWRQTILVVFMALICVWHGVAFGISSVVSPKEGVWANKQVLLLNLETGEDVFYSWNATDPLTEGMAYDGACVLDVVGKVALHLTSVSAGGSRTDMTINYEVKPVEAIKNNTFLRYVGEAGLLRYEAGQQFVIPSDCDFCLHDSNAWAVGRDLAVNELCNINQYVPCTLDYKGNLWRIIIDVRGRQTGNARHESVPILVEEWDTLHFNDKKLIYKVDNGLWQQFAEPLKIDRTIDHEISWQSIAYKKGNPIHSYVLPKRQEVKCLVSDLGAYTYSIGAGWTFENTREGDSKMLALGAHDNLVLDTFLGDRLVVNMKVAVFYGGVQQGYETIACDIDKRPPAPPQIISSCDIDFSREAVEVDIRALGKKDKLHYTLIALTDTGDNKYETKEEYTVGQLEQIYLDVSDKGAVHYKLQVYALGLNNIASKTTTYSVTVDNINYYLDEKATAINATGSKEMPFNNIKQALDKIGTLKVAVLHIMSNVNIDAPFLIKNNIKIVGSSSFCIDVAQDANIKVENANFTLVDCVIKVQNGWNNVNLSLFQLNKATCNLLNSRILFIAGDRECVISATDSILNMTGTFLNLEANYYGCLVSSTNTKINVLQCNMVCTAGTAVCFSINNGTLDISRSTCFVQGKLGRITELSGVRASLVGNTFTAKLDNIEKTEILYKDALTVISKDMNNIYNGF